MPKDMENAFPKYEDGPGPGRELSSPSAAPPQTCLTSVHGRAQHLCEKGRNRGTPSQRYHPYETTCLLKVYTV